MLSLACMLGYHTPRRLDPKLCAHCGKAIPIKNVPVSRTKTTATPHRHQHPSTTTPSGAGVRPVADSRDGFPVESAPPIASLDPSQGRDGGSRPGWSPGANPASGARLPLAGIIAAILLTISAVALAWGAATGTDSNTVVDVALPAAAAFGIAQLVLPGDER